MQSAIYVDAAHATDLKTRQTISGLVAKLNGTAISYKSKWQPTVSTISREVYFTAAVSSSNMTKHLHYFLD